MNDPEVDNVNQIQPVTLGGFARILAAYRLPIFLSLLAVVTGFTIIAALVLLTSPAEVVTTQPFRLEFEGAAEGQYPNGTKFSPAEIVSVPILVKVYESNDLKRFLPFSDFTKALYVLESNPVLERLSREYAARLADPKLSPVDRDRIVREFESRRESISKNEYSLNFSTPRGAPPDAIVKKILSEVLREWASYTVREQRVLQYQVSVLSPNTIPAGASNLNYIGRLQILRSNIYRVVMNVDEIEKLPGSKLVRTRNQQLSLADIRVQLEDLVRFRLEPLVPAIRGSGLIPNLGDAIRFCETQLAYDERRLLYARQRASVIREALNTYTRNASDPPPDAVDENGDNQRQATRPSDSVAPLLSETFLERLMTMTAAASDVEYRQRLIDDYRAAASMVLPLEQATAYDRDLIAQLRSAAGTASSLSPQQVEAEIRALHAEARRALEQINELYGTISRNLQPETHMFIATSVPETRTHRTASWRRLAVIGLLVTLLSIPLILAGVLIHNRLRQEEEVEEHAHDRLEARTR